MVNRFLSRVSRLTTTLESLIFTGHCIVCGLQSHRKVDICQSCEDELPWSTHPCLRCALPLTAAIDHKTDTCGQCLLLPPLFHRAQTSWLYKPPIAQLISAFKYQRRYSYGRVLGELSAKKIANTYLHQPLPDILIATPLHWRRQLSRGFNQSSHICEYLSQHLGIPIYRRVNRIKATPPQLTLDAPQRQKNIEGAFKIVDIKPLQGRRIAIVDDVLTTGATATELSRYLLAAGAKEIHVWCLARTPLP